MCRASAVWASLMSERRKRPTSAKPRIINRLHKVPIRDTLLADALSHERRAVRPGSPRLGHGCYSVGAFLHMAGLSSPKPRLEGRTHAPPLSGSRGRCTSTVCIASAIAASHLRRKQGPRTCGDPGAGEQERPGKPAGSGPGYGWMIQTASPGRSRDGSMARSMVGADR